MHDLSDCMLDAPCDVFHQIVKRPVVWDVLLEKVTPRCCAQQSCCLHLIIGQTLLRLLQLLLREPVGNLLKFCLKLLVLLKFGKLTIFAVKLLFKLPIEE